MKHDPHHEAALDALEGCLHNLHRRAVTICYDHWEEIKVEEKKRSGFESRSNLWVATHRKGNHVQMKWTGVKWTGTSTNRRSYKVNIPMSKVEFGYSSAKLSEHAKDWELPIAEATEQKLKSLRRQAHHLVRSIMALKNAIQISKNQPIEIHEEEAAADL